MTTQLPNSPVRKISRCRQCNTVSVRFYDSKHDCSYTQEEWLTICEQGKEALRKILQPVTGNPIFFLE
jgi:ribosomal protein S12